jgi:hypothetical protein
VSIPDPRIDPGRTAVVAVDFQNDIVGADGAFAPMLRAVLTGIVDTDRCRDVDIPKASAESVARAILDGVEKDEEDIFPDPMAESMPASWRSGAAKALERQYAALAEATWASGGTVNE